MSDTSVKLAAIGCLLSTFLFSASPAHAAQVWYDCHVSQIWDGTSTYTYYSASCVEPWTQGSASVTTLVVPLAPDKDRAARFFNVAMAALLSGRMLSVMFDSEQDLTVCPGDCRTALYFGLKR
jgi:hypothetical protein